LDYIETIKQWKKRLHAFHPKKYALFLSMLPRYLKDKKFRHQLSVLRESPNSVCFEQEIMDHYRLVFEKV
jgi:cyclopropane-fatty-acyl-phospholipid synthase